MPRLILAILAAMLYFSPNHILRAEESVQGPDLGIRYISDYLVINIRNNVERPYMVVGAVHSGEQVKIIERQGNYVKIETGEGKQGWIGQQYLKQDLPKSLAVKKLEREIALLKAGQNEQQPAAGGAGGDSNTANSNCLASLSDLEQKLSTANDTIDKLQQEKEFLAKNGDQAQSAETGVKLQKENIALHNELTKTKKEYEQLVAKFEKRGKEIGELQNTLGKQDSSSKIMWFGAGAMVFLTGMLSGKISNRKKSKFSY